MGRKRQSNHDDPPRFHRKGKTWYHVALVDGKRKWTKLSTDRAESLRMWAQVEGVRADDSTKLFSVIVQRYQREVYPLKAPRTRQDNDKELIHLLRVLGHMPIDAILPMHIRQYMDIRGETAKTRANREKALFSHIFNKAREWGYTASQNPCQGVRGFKERGRDRYVTDEEFAKVRELAHPTVQDAMDLALLTGQRPADVLKIQTRDIRDGAVWVTQNKTGARIGIEITGELQTVIARIGDRPHRAISPFLIQEENGQPLTLTVLRNRFEKAKKLAGVEFQFRDIRAKAATDTGDLAHSQKLLAHKNREMTEHYVRSRIGEELARRGDELYEQEIRPQVERANEGRILAIDVDTGDYGVAALGAEYIDGKGWNGVGFPSFEAFQFVDNSTQSYFDHKAELDATYASEKRGLQVRIVYDQESGVLRIFDNAMGMSYDELKRALHVALRRRGS